MEYGVHLPQITFEGQTWSLHRFVAYTETAEQLVLLRLRGQMARRELPVAN